MKCLIVIALCLVTGINASLLNKEEGEGCKIINGEEWTCRALINCPQIGDFKHSRPAICSFREKEPIICCPPNHFMDQDFFHDINEPKTTTEKESSSSVDPHTEETPVKTTEYINVTVRDTPSICTIKCMEYETRLCHNRSIEKPRISRDVSASSVKINFRQNVVGGQPATLNQFSFMVAIGYGEDPNIVYECGGTVVSEYWILSAAHCAHSKSGKAKWVGLCAVMMSPELIGLSLPIMQIIVHPSYKATEAYHNIALFKLETKLQFNDYMEPVCLNPSKLLPRVATVAGWKTEGDKTNVNLIYENLNMVHPELCKNMYDDSTLLPHGYDNELMFCAYEGNKDSCISGGPVFYNSSNSCLDVQLGIFSFRHNCGTYPGVYTRISHYVPWIESVVWPSTKSVIQS